MKKLKLFTVLTVVLASLTATGTVQAGCCDDAKKAGKECTHKCCIEAAKAKKTCEKCNPKAAKTEKKTEEKK